MLETVKTAISLFGRTGKAYNQPAYVNLDITNACNLKCRMCYQNEPFFQPPKGEDRFIPLETVRLVFSQIKPQIFALGGLGEPLLHKDVVEITRIAKQSGSLPMITTNGHLLTKEMSRSLIEAGMGQIKVSIDAVTQETYSKIRQSDGLHKVMDNVRDLIQVEKEMGRQYEIVRLEYVIQKYNIDEIIPFIKMASKLGVRFVNFMAINFIAVSDSTEDTYKEEYNLEKLLKTLHEARRVAKELGIRENLSELMIGHDTIKDVKNFKISKDDFFFPWYKNVRYRNFVCYEPWLQMGIHRNGDVAICCVAFHPKHNEKALVFGNIYKGDRLDDIWNSPRLRKFRRAVAKKKNFDAIDLCGQCIYRRFLFHEIRKNNLLSFDKLFWRKPKGEQG